MQEIGYKEQIIRKNKDKNNQLLTLSGALGNPAQYTYISHRG